MSKLLLVEDDETIVENLCVFLQQEGFFVESVFGQKQAIELLEEKYYDLVLLDISLADGNGFAICSYIKQNTDIPVIFLTASGDEYSVVTGLDMGRMIISVNHSAHVNWYRELVLYCDAVGKPQQFWNPAVLRLIPEKQW